MPVFPTQLYSLIANLGIATILLGMWFYNWPWPIVGASYLVLSSLARFAEENFRGESQTPVLCGLPLYQWTAIVGLISGVLIAFINGSALAARFSFDINSILIASGIGVLVTLSMAADFPDSRKPFSRLSPK